MPRVTNGVSSADSRMNCFALQNSGHYATRTVGIYGIYNRLPSPCHSLGKQFKHATLEANDAHTISSALPRACQDQNAPSSSETLPLRLLSEVDEALPIGHGQRRVHRLKVEATEQHYHQIMAGQACADAVSSTNMPRPPPRLRSRHAGEGDVVWGISRSSSMTP
jgi:hypothetical protein